MQTTNEFLVFFSVILSVLLLLIVFSIFFTIGILSAFKGAIRSVTMEKDLGIVVKRRFVSKFKEFLQSIENEIDNDQKKSA